MTPAVARELLGLDADAGVDDVLAARRRLAKRAHPDVGGDPTTMQQLNEAVTVILAHLRPGNVGAPPRPMPAKAASASAEPRPAGGVAHDVASFTIEALPAEAFEALLVVTSWIGEVANDEPPYQLDVVLDAPLTCWCRLDLIPEAGASTVSLTVAVPPGTPRPDVDDVRDVWVAALNELGR